MDAAAGATYGDLLREVHRVDLLSRRVADLELSERLGMGRAMFLILEMLSDADVPHPSQQAIARHLGLTRAAVSRHVQLAQEQGWLQVRRSTASLRENSVRLTAPGRALVARGRRHRVAAARGVAADLTVREMQRTAETLARLSVLLEQRLAEHAGGNA